MKRILLTGASGDIGRTIFDKCRDCYQFTLADITPQNGVISTLQRNVVANLGDPDSLAALCEGIDAVVHLAGIPRLESDYDALLPANILATTNLLKAAHDAGCQRFVFANSAQAIEGYVANEKGAPSMAAAPTGFYGVTKCYGESLCSYYATQKGMSCVALRIGTFKPIDKLTLANARCFSSWLSPRDAVHLIIRAIEAKIDGFVVGHGISNNRFTRLDLSETKRVLGYFPKDDAFCTIR